MTGILLFATLATPVTTKATTVIRQLPVNNGTKIMGWADAVVNWNLIGKDQCAAGTVSNTADEGYSNVTIYVAAYKNGTIKANCSNSGQIHIELPTPLKINCDSFYSKHTINNGTKTYYRAMST